MTSASHSSELLLEEEMRFDLDWLPRTHDVRMNDPLHVPGKWPRKPLGGL